MAHEAKSLQLGLTGGFLHPLLGPDHLLAMIAVGLWGAFLGRPLVYLLPIIFPSVMTLGAIMAMAGLVLPPVEVGIALSVLLLGAILYLPFLSGLFQVEPLSLRDLGSCALAAFANLAWFELYKMVRSRFSTAPAQT